MSIWMQASFNELQLFGSLASCQLLEGTRRSVCDVRLKHTNSFKIEMLCAKTPLVSAMSRALSHPSPLWEEKEGEICPSFLSHVLKDRGGGGKGEVKMKKG